VTARLAAVTVLGMLLALAAMSVVVYVARTQREEPTRCPSGMSALGARCCGRDQALKDGACTGDAISCADTMMLTKELPRSCVAPHRRIAVRGGRLELKPSDWESSNLVLVRDNLVPAFELDAAEVTLERWLPCVTTGHCRTLPGEEELGRPVRGVSPEEAERFCRFDGGRLPRSEEWIFAASAGGTRRFPWGQTGLVCRRAAYGLVDGPCAHGGTGPELSSARVDGASAEGFLDLIGNVAEWTREPDGSYVARGGSYRSRSAAELKSFSFADTRAPREDIGLRCAYDVGLRSADQP
jgi:formylglycine-generating enzyme required for sulfatase activity